jgi:hypothetical protein
MFSLHEKSKFWSKRNLKKPNEVALNSHKKFWFDCSCGHDFESSLLNINQSNNWCGYCSNPPKRLCENNNCSMVSLDEHNRNAACMGFNTNTNFVRDLLIEFYNCSQIKECIAPYGSSRVNHRQDQAVFTILFYKYKYEYNFYSPYTYYNKYIGHTIQNDID